MKQIPRFVWLLLFLTWCGVTSAMASGNTLHFLNLSVAEGLSQVTVYAIAQDQQGYLWFGTQDGLNRYDGYTFTVYKYVADDPHSMSGNKVRAIYIDRDGVLWAGTQHAGLNRFDRDTEQFTHYRHNPTDPHTIGSDQVYAITEDGAGNLWVGTVGGGLNRLDKARGTFTRYLHHPDDPHSLPSNSVNSLLVDSHGQLWVHSKTLLRFDHTTDSFISYGYEETDPTRSQTFLKNITPPVVEDAANNLWIGASDGIIKYNPVRGTYHFFPYDVAGASDMTDTVVSVLFLDSTGMVWVGTGGNGLYLFNPQTAQFTHYRHDPNNSASLSDNGIHSIFEDRSGVVWVGTRVGGLSKYERAADLFTHIYHDPNSPNTLSNNLIWALYEEHHMLWIGTIFDGLNRLDRASGHYTYYRHDPTDATSLSHNTVMSLLRDAAGVLWVGTANGLNRFDETTHTFHHYLVKKDTPYIAIRTLYQDVNGTIWLGTSDGLKQFSPRTGEVVTYLITPHAQEYRGANYVSGIVEDQQGMMWVSTQDGLALFDRATTTFTLFVNDPHDPHSISYNELNCIFVDHRGTVWIGTGGGGLNRLHRDEHGKPYTFSAYTERDGLPNDIVYGILEDERGHLWMSTNNGIARFDPTTGAWKSFGVEHGLQSTEFNGGATFRNPGGEMFFGGVNGFNIFHPAHIVNNPYIPPIVITALQHNGTDIAGKAVEAGEVVHLNWQHNAFDFTVAALSYTQPHHNVYEYMLDGFDKTWLSVHQRRFGQYTNVPGGTYTLRVRGANNDGVWNTEGIAITIVVNPPWWQTWWFITITMLGTVAMAWGMMQWRVGVIYRRNQHLEAQVAERTAQLTQKTHALIEVNQQLEVARDAADKANQAKSMFLANMNHEMRTPLNAILGFVQLLSKHHEMPDAYQNAMNVIRHNSEHLLAVINDVLDMAKIEAGHLICNNTVFCVAEMLHTMDALFAEQAHAKHLAFDIVCANDIPSLLYADEQKVRQVLINMLSNALKYTETGSIRLSVTIQNTATTTPHYLVFTVRDTGIGIAPHEQGRLFEPFVQATVPDTMRGGTGLGLAISQQFVHAMGGTMGVESDVGQGATFWFTLPLTIDMPAPHAAPHTTTPCQPNIAVIQAEIALLPHELHEQLLLATIRGDMCRISTLLHDVALHDTSLAMLLAQRADEFDYETMIRLLRK